MEYRVAILSGDVTFARMLELECRWMQLSVYCGVSMPSGDVAQLAIVDLDDDVNVDLSVFSAVIGFTRRSTVQTVDIQRRCSLILHRPFEMQLFRRELMTQLKDGFEKALPSKESRILRSLSISPERTALCCGDTSIPLSPKEALVMECLLAERGKIVDKERLSRCIGLTHTNKTEVYVCYLRRKLQRISSALRIVAVRGKGYRLDAIE